MRADNRRTSPTACKREAVHLVTEPGDAVTEAARHLGLTPPRLQRWKRALTEPEPVAFPGNGRVGPAPEELRQVQEENQRWRMARDRLQKALGFCASESRGAWP
jgi:transposase-like protein